MLIGKPQPVRVGTHPRFAVDSAVLVAGNETEVFVPEGGTGAPVASAADTGVPLLSGLNAVEPGDGAVGEVEGVAASALPPFDELEPTLLVAGAAEAGSVPGGEDDPAGDPAGAALAF